MDQINILVTDDEREIADLLEIYLVSDGYRVWKAYSAKEGLKFYRSRYSAGYFRHYDAGDGRHRRCADRLENSATFQLSF